MGDETIWSTDSSMSNLKLNMLESTFIFRRNCWDIHNLLGDIKRVYEEGIKPILIKNSPAWFRNPLFN
jgi:hypothetical protein